MRRPASPPAWAPETAAARGLALCHACGKLEPATPGRCPRCGAGLHLRKPDSLQRTWALLAAAAILYVPANVLPVLRVSSALTGNQDSTILSGVIQFWGEGDYPVALIIFTASVMIPILKVVALVWLCLAARSGRRAHATTRLYRIVEFIGRWSMVDVFVVSILVAVVQLGAVMSIAPGPGALSFAAVVVLTMLASETFDPRLVWDAAAAGREAARPPAPSPTPAPAPPPAAALEPTVLPPDAPRYAR